MHHHNKMLRWLIQSPQLFLLPPQYHLPKAQAQAMYDEVDGLLNSINWEPLVPTRYGHYIEWLLKHYFQASEQYLLIHHSKQIVQQGITLGEVDFIVQHIPTGEVQHWEVACKYYVAQAGLDYPGPNKKDSLNRKYAHLTEKQLVLLGRPDVQRFTKLKVDRCIGFTKGVVFYPHHLPTHPKLMPEHLRAKVVRNNGQPYSVINKPYWPLPLDVTQETIGPYPKLVLIEDEPTLLLPNDW